MNDWSAPPVQQDLFICWICGRIYKTYEGWEDHYEEEHTTEGGEDDT